MIWGYPYGFNPRTWEIPTTPRYWHTIIGKGILYPNSTEFDNYQLVAIGNKLYFEWSGTGGTHYHSQTNSNALTNGAWQYVTVNVQQNGQPQMYVNGDTSAFNRVYGKCSQCRDSNRCNGEPRRTIISLSKSGNRILMPIHSITREILEIWHSITGHSPQMKYSRIIRSYSA